MMNSSNKDDELLDLVNRNDEVIGTINRLDYQRILDENLGYIRAADLYIVNSQGQIYVPVRTADKTIAPNGFDYSAGGHVGAGEDYLTAIIREANEEINLVLREDQLELVSKQISDTTRYISCFYIVRSDATLTINPEDFVKANWAYPDEIISQIDKGHPAKTHLKETILLLKDYLTKQ